MSRKGESPEVESRLVVASGWRKGGNGGMITNGYGKLLFRARKIL